MEDRGPIKTLSEEIERWYEKETGLSASTGAGGRGPGAGRFLDLLVWLEEKGLLAVEGIRCSITSCRLVMHSDEAWRTRGKRTDEERAALQLGASRVELGGKTVRRWFYVVAPAAAS